MFSRTGKGPERDFSFIGPEVTVTGSIVTTGRLHVDGTVRGDIQCGTLSQGGSGAVHGNIVAENATLSGLVDGAVEAGTLVLEASARITGDVLYESLGIATGAQVEGRFRRRKGAEGRGEAAAGLLATERIAELAGSGERIPRRAAAGRGSKPPELFAGQLVQQAEAAE